MACPWFFAAYFYGSGFGGNFRRIGAGRVGHVALAQKSEIYRQDAKSAEGNIHKSTFGRSHC